MTKRTTASETSVDGPSAATGQDDGKVNRSVILQSALRIVDRDGVDGLSMRRLSDEVGRDPTVIYRHVPTKAALLDGVAEIVLGQLRVDTEDPDWTGQLRAVAHDFRRLALAHPNVVPLLVTRPLATPLGQRPSGMLRPSKMSSRCSRSPASARWTPAHLPRALRVPVRPHPHRAAGGHRATRGNRRCPAP